MGGEGRDSDPVVYTTGYNEESESSVLTCTNHYQKIIARLGLLLQRICFQGRGGVTGPDRIMFTCSRTLNFEGNRRGEEGKEVKSIYKLFKICNFFIGV